ncbi:MAG TPA: hypothetical protein HPP81_05150 [Deltaproteobacteria bacterium]|jgi:hypothetical protein|nr:hypothetical protein [Deltaproteobacteria bacterium]HIJ76084.1 hypothetical protein [Deltaproteobacteria bacterium]
MEGEFDFHIVDELMYDGMVDIGGANGNIKLTPRGEELPGKESQVEPQEHQAPARQGKGARGRVAQVRARQI